MQEKQAKPGDYFRGTFGNVYRFVARTTLKGSPAALVEHVGYFKSYPYPPGGVIRFHKRLTRFPKPVTLVMWDYWLNENNATKIPKPT